MKNSADTPEPTQPESPSWPPGMDSDPPLEPVGGEEPLQPVGEDAPLEPVGDELVDEPVAAEPEPEVEEPVEDEPEEMAPAFAVPSADAARDVERPSWDDDADMPVVDLDEEPTAVTTPLDAVTHDDDAPTRVQAPAAVAVRDETAAEEPPRRARRRPSISAGSHDTRKLILAGLLAVAVGFGIYALAFAGGDDNDAAPAPAQPAAEQPAANEPPATADPAASGQAVAAGWKRVSVPSGGFSVDAPPNFDVSVNGALVVMKAPGRLTSYAVNGSKGTDVKVQTVAGSLLDSYKQDFALTSSKVGAVASPSTEVDRQVDMSAAGTRKSDDAKQWMGARVFRIDTGVYVVQGFTGENEQAKRQAWRDQLRAVAKTIQPL